ncbi:hypothetical protein MMPV_009269 [Pyropia vietnamensis]
MPPLPLFSILLAFLPSLPPFPASLRLPPAGGFTRLTLVPKDQWTSKAAHAERAFWYSCWSAGREACPAADKDKAASGRCYDDGDGSRFGTMMTIPRVVPDGEYVLGYAWYGGLGDGFTESFFGDYYDCAVVTVSGGSPIQAQEPVVFKAGEGSPYGDQCEATANKLGVCPVEPCPGRKKSLMTPASFDGKTPAPLTPALFGGTSEAGGSGPYETKGQEAPAQAPGQPPTAGQYETTGQDVAAEATDQKPAASQEQAAAQYDAPGQEAPISAPGQQPAAGQYQTTGQDVAATAAGQKPTTSPKPAAAQYEAPGQEAPTSAPGQQPATGQYQTTGQEAPAQQAGQKPAAGQQPAAEQQPAAGQYKADEQKTPTKAPGAQPMAGQYEGTAQEEPAAAEGQQPAAGPYAAGKTPTPAAGATDPKTAAPSAQTQTKTPPPAESPPFAYGDTPSDPATTPDKVNTPAVEDGPKNLGLLSVDGIAILDTGSGTVSVPSAQLLSSGVAASTTTSLIAILRGPVNYVEFFVNGAWAATESYAPYAIAGNNGGTFPPWPPLATGGTSISMRVVAYDVERNLAERTFHFSITP